MSKFYAVEAAPAKETKIVFGAISEIFHLSIIAIPAGSQGHSTLYATIDGSTFAVATVDSAKGVLQVAVDMILPASQKPVLTVKGNTKLHLSGYVDDMSDMGGAPAGEDFSDDGDSEEDEESGEEMELPVTKATKAIESQAKAQTKAAPAAPAKAESEDDEEDFDDEEDISLGDLEEGDLDMDEEDFDEEDLDFDEEDFDSEEDDEDDEVAAPPATKARIEGKPSGIPQGKPQQGKPQQQSGKPQAGRQTGQKYGRV
eukprot:GILI01006350.1.p1 GENE.GILI01006350.1~~GILI01006350.1.p1  ORF type:complete len:257 (-),score=135.89 GILI01006350.1:132-902(-)